VYLGGILLFVSLDFGLLILFDFLPNHDHAAMKTAEVLLLGLIATGFGTFVVLVPQIIGTVYPPINFGTYLSYMQVGSSLWGALVPFLVETIVEATGTFDYVYGFFAISCIISAVILFRVEPPQSVPESKRASVSSDQVIHSALLNNKNTSNPTVPTSSNSNSLSSSSTNTLVPSSSSQKMSSRNPQSPSYKQTTVPDGDSAMKDTPYTQLPGDPEA